MSTARFGENEQCLRRELARFNEARWLAPDAAFAALDEEATVWIRDRLDELLAALTPWGGDALPSAMTLHTTRSMHEAERRWRSAWEASSDDESPTLRAFDRAIATLPPSDVGRARRRRRAIEELVRRAVEPALERLDTLSVRLEEGSSLVPQVSTRGLTELVTRHLEWVIAWGDARPSPFAPLLAIWRRGAWPVLLPGDAAVVYMPVEHDGRVLPWIEGDPINYAPERPSLAKHGPRRRTHPAEARTQLPTWWERGVSQPPTFDLRLYEVAIAGAMFDVGDAPVDDLTH